MKQSLRRNTKIYDDSPVPLTPEGLKRLERRLLRLKQALPNLISETARTAAYGDRSDNAEYKDAKSTLRRTHRQIWSIEQQLRKVQIINSDKNNFSTVQLGSTVVLESQKGIKKTFQIVGSYETNPGRGRISHLSPLGAALMNHAKGNVITFKTAQGHQEYRILEIR
ncbi:MAG: GreA/GreB family elongation factor [Patescibacteria group bacterium]